MNTAEKYSCTETHNADAPLRVDSVRIEWIPDDWPDVSFLEQSYDDCEPAEAEKYRAQDKERLEAFHRGEWYMAGCVARATVSRPIGSGSRRLEEFSSAGLWGIESDSDEDYRAQVEAEQLEDLKQHLEAFGIPWPDGVNVATIERSVRS